MDNEEPAVEHAARWIVFLARVGYVAKGVVYIVVGALAARAALGMGGGTIDTRGAISTIGEGPFGTAALVTIAVGLLGYALWRLINAWTDAEWRGDDPSGIAIRLGGAFRGLAYGAFGLQTLDYLTDRLQGETDQLKAMTAKLLALPGGKWLVVAAGLGFVGYGLYQLYRASTDKVLRHLDVVDAGHDRTKWIRGFAKFGVAARAIVFGMIGVLLMRAAWRFNAAEAGGIDDSLDALARVPQGMLVLAIVALGLISYGLFQLATARYRKMRAHPTQAV